MDRSCYKEAERRDTFHKRHFSEEYDAKGSKILSQGCPATKYPLQSNPKLSRLSNSGLSIGLLGALVSMELHHGTSGVLGYQCRNGSHASP
jgi:hypothetical protein